MSSEAVASDKFKADPPDASPLHEMVRKLWEAQLSDASKEHKRLMALAATELEGHLPPVVPPLKLDLWPNNLSDDTLEAGRDFLEFFPHREGARVLFIPRARLQALAQELAALGVDVVVEPKEREPQPMRYRFRWPL